MIGRRRWISALTGTALAIGATLAIGCGNGGSGAAPAGSGAGSAAPAAAADKEWKVGAFLSLSGPEAQFGIDTREGIELAVEEINAKDGGPKGKPIKVLFEDDKSNPQEANNKVLQLIDRDKVIAILGEVASGRSRQGGIVANKKKIPMITPSSTHPDITKIGPFVFRVCFVDDFQGQAGAQFVVSTLGKKRLAVLFASDVLYSTGLTKEFKDEAKRLGAEIVIEKGFLQTETNFTTYINEIKDAKPDIIYAPVYYNHMAPIAKQAKSVGVSADMFVGGDGWDGMAAEDLVNMEGAYLTSHYAPDDPAPRVQDFLKRYQAKFKREPTALAANGYDAAGVLADAMKRAKSDTAEGIRDAIAETKDYPGVTGNTTIDPDRNAKKQIVVVQIKGGKQTFKSVVAPK
jgi:branched-chain amino acid transport system substrate-binding protein